MAEGFANSIKSDVLMAYSAGTKKHGINPRAVQVMKEVGIDISSNESNTTDELPEQNFDIVFTVCSDAHENCPYFSGGKIIHVGFEDPPRLTAEITDEEEILKIYRRVRDEIKDFVNNIESYLGE
ncbi:MAG: arsenate reductase ArsC [Bacteriovoracaceae bacterium]|nr:arsenate reductase ArsC [Bacteriovoracaceae bacterium]